MGGLTGTSTQELTTQSKLLMFSNAVKGLFATQQQNRTVFQVVIS